MTLPALTSTQFASSLGEFPADDQERHRHSRNNDEDAEGEFADNDHPAPGNQQPQEAGAEHERKGLVAAHSASKADSCHDRSTTRRPTASEKAGCQVLRCHTPAPAAA